MNILVKLSEIRREKKIKQNEIASYLRVSDATMNRYEQGIRKIPLSQVEKYAEYLGYELKLMVK